MEQIISNLRPFTFKVFFALLLLAPGCNFNGNNRNKQPLAQNATTVNIAPDSLDYTGNVKLDSLLRVAATAKQDTNLAKLYYEIGDIYINADSEKAKEYYLRLDSLSRKLNWNTGRYLFASGYTYILNREGMPDSSIVILQETLELAKAETKAEGMNEKNIAIILANLANCYRYKQWNETALKYYNEVLPLFEKQNDKFKVAITYNMMGAVYNALNMQDENLLYSEKALAIYAEKPDTLSRVSALNNYAVALIDNNEFEKAKNCLLEAQRICKLHNARYYLSSIYINLGNIAIEQNDLDKAEMYIRKAMEFDSEFDNTEANSTVNRIFGNIEKLRGNFDLSEKYAKKALDIANEYDLSIEKKESYKLLSELSIARRDFPNYRFYLAKADSIEKAAVSEKTQRYAKEMEAKYETEKKELKITALEKKRQLVIWLSIAGGGVLLLALTTFILLWRWTVQKRRLAETRIKQFEQEKQLIATHAVLEGETTERARLARDLHDGLGSMLTGVKLNLLELKKGAALDFAEVERFDNAVGLLDESISEMRRVAHHLMPDSLSRFGLKSAVGDFCKMIPFIHFSYYGDESRLNPELEAIVYRCIYEMVNNALKHAGAQKILVQIMLRPDSIAFTVQDDGCGFDPSTITEGIGLQNIRTRVAAYNGIMNIDSKAGEGTEINVELRIEN